MSDDRRDRLSIAGRRLPAAFARREVVIAPGDERPYDPSEWRDALVIVKRGEYGALLFSGGGAFAIPGLPLEEVRDPTGAGDSFAGGFLGYLDGVRVRREHDDRALRQAMAYGSVMASFNVEDFGTTRLGELQATEVAERLAEFKRLTHFEAQPA